uniref:Arogenate dehydrogenase n=1 Tax=uncultured Candidatus Melainabacteria bacterium TaxID=2682970 RepID=A0A650ELE3_9BACT|nr:arogenate dehydrogenase [uncultured Candidatus Melainabacteria bacterium]
MKIGVVGLGLIGGSIFKDLQELNYNVIAVSKTQNGDNIYKDYDVLKTCDIVFVCSAMNKTLEILDKLEEVLLPDTIVTDVCSLKEFVSKKQRPYKFIPSHPMAGTEHKGFENSFAGLFKGAKWVITPVFGEDGRLVELIEELGAIPVITTPEKHDEAVALISHMPMVIAQAIFKTASENPLALEIAASGFRDMTRLAMSNTEMANDMVQMNADNIQTSILKLYKSIGDLTNSDYLEQIDEIKLNRQSMFL